MNFTIPAGMRAPVIDWFGDKWRCQLMHPGGRVSMGMWGMGDTPDEAFASWYRANVPKWAPGGSPWSFPTEAQLASLREREAGASA